MKKYKSVFDIAVIYMGLIIGAGFASGREVITFFTSYGAVWPFGLIITGALLALTGYIILSIMEKKSINTYSAFVSTVMGEKTAGIMEAVSGIFLCILFFAMVSASGSLLYEAFGIKRLWGSIALSAFCFIILKGGEDKLIKVNALLSPVMISGTAFVCIVSLFKGMYTMTTVSDDMSEMPFMILFSAIIYVSYNIISAVSVFTGASDIAIKDKKAKYGAIIGGSVMAVAGLLIGLVLACDSKLFSLYDIPLLFAISRNGELITYIYMLVLIGAIITTAAGNGYGAKKWIEDKTGIKDGIIDLSLCICAVVFSFAGFAEFTDKVYPLFGFLGLAELFCIFKYYFNM